MGQAHIGASGWNYKHWAKGVFYPNGLKPAEWLPYYAQQLRSVEINNTFYRLPGEATFQNWRTHVPQDFVFSVKASRFITHIKRLKEPEEPLDLFFSRVQHLKDRLGPVLFQLPPRFMFDPARLEVFLTSLKPHLKRSGRRCAIEVRDRTWLVEPVFEMLRAYGVALCFADWREMPVTGPITADFIYVRRHHGRGEGGNYTQDALDRDVAQISSWLGSGFDVFVYFNNDLGGYAIRNARYVQDALSARSDRRKPAARSTRPLDSWKPA
jgi:uncharacterized protein YecE (DUF72 family)